MLQLVFATDKYAGFGLGDGFPWDHIPEDLKQFKQNTQDTILVMGAKTFATLPCKLPGRKHVVFADLDRISPCAKNGDDADMFLPADQMEEYFEKWSKSGKTYSVIGGAQILYRAFAYADKVIHTVILPDNKHANTIKKADVHLNEYMFNKLMNRNHSEFKSTKYQYGDLFTFIHNMKQD